jgi:hypothetical protein
LEKAMSDHGVPLAFAFGQPVGGLVQVAYTVADIKAGMRDFTARLNIGPWFVTGPFVTPEGQYRGKPTRLELTLAMTFAGHVMIELIEQHNDVPSVYREYIDRRGHGFHHWAIGSRSFDDDVARYRGKGFEVAFSDRSPRGNRVVYMDTTAELNGMVEIIEMTEVLDARYAMMFEVSRGWDGRDPVRK